MLTLEMLKNMEEGTIFAEGTANDDPNGLFMANTNRALKWVAVRGGIHDWCICCHFADKTNDWIKSFGDKVYFESNIKKLVPCSAEAYEMYRF